LATILQGVVSLKERGHVILTGYFCHFGKSYPAAESAQQDNMLDDRRLVVLFGADFLNCRFGWAKLQVYKRRWA
jgi:hypothetical protein